MKPALQPSLKARALRLISMREHSRTELVRKLARFEEQPGSLLLALDDLQAKGLISEQRVIASVLHRQAGKFGGARIRQTLQALGLESEAIGLAIGSLQGSEAERAQAVWQKKIRLASNRCAVRSKTNAFFVGPGFRRRHCPAHRRRALPGIAGVSQQQIAVPSSEPLQAQHQTHILNRRATRPLAQIVQTRDQHRMGKAIVGRLVGEHPQLHAAGVGQ